MESSEPAPGPSSARRPTAARAPRRCCSVPWGASGERPQVHDPLGRPIEARFALVRDGATAIVEAAAASGLALVPEDERDPEAASSAGTGELIAAAIESGARRVLVAAGGTATMDGGRGAIEALQEAERSAGRDPGGPLRHLGAVRARRRGVRGPEGGLRRAGRAPELAPGRPRRHSAARSARQGDDRRRRWPLRRALGRLRRPPRPRSDLRARRDRLRPRGWRRRTP